MSAPGASSKNFDRPLLAQSGRSSPADEFRAVSALVVVRTARATSRPRGKSGGLGDSCYRSRKYEIRVEISTADRHALV
jgi:hypothetical protein